MRSLRFAIFGYGFWARYQLADWHEAGGAELVGLYNRTLSKAHGLADEFGLPRTACFDDPETLLRTVRPDFADIITNVEPHAPLSALAAHHGKAAICEMSYASRLEHERFPETYVLAECERGSVELGPDYWVRTTTREGTLARRCPPARYVWADSAYDVVHASIVDCNRNLLAGLAGAGSAETTSGDNLKTVELVHAAYASAAESRAITLGGG